MNIYKWFKVFNLGEFTDLGLVSQEVTLELDELGLKDFLITQGNLVSITHEGVILPINLNELNPFEFESMAVYLDEDLLDVYIGFLEED